MRVKDCEGCEYCVKSQGTQPRKQNQLSRTRAFAYCKKHDKRVLQVTECAERRTGQVAPFYTLNDARAQLPKVGDVRWEIPTIDESRSTRVDYFKKPQKCVVVDVHPRQLWYTVRFENGIKESYKVPRLKPGGGDGNGN